MSRSFPSALLSSEALPVFIYRLTEVKIVVKVPTSCDLAWIVQKEKRGDLVMSNVREKLKAERAELVQARGTLIQTFQRWSEQQQRDCVSVDLSALLDEYFTLEVTYQHQLEETLDALGHRLAQGMERA
jgi:hypothetical protein